MVDGGVKTRGAQPPAPALEEMDPGLADAWRTHPIDLLASFPEQKKKHDYPAVRAERPR